MPKQPWVFGEPHPDARPADATPERASGRASKPRKPRKHEVAEPEFPYRATISPRHGLPVIDCVVTVPESQYGLPNTRKALAHLAGAVGIEPSELPIVPLHLRAGHVIWRLPGGLHAEFRKEVNHEQTTLR